VHALEKLGVRHTFGIPGVHNTELYDELNNSSQITPVLVTHEGGAAFMADATSRVCDSIGTMVIVPAAGVTHAASGIGEALLAGVPMLVISGGVRTDLPFKYQLHQIDQHAFLRPLTKATFLVQSHRDVVPTIYAAWRIATSGEPGPVFVELPVNLQLFPGEVDEIPALEPPPAFLGLQLVARLREIVAAGAIIAVHDQEVHLGAGDFFHGKNQDSSFFRIARSSRKSRHTASALELGPPRSLAIGINTPRAPTACGPSMSLASRSPR